MGPNNLPKVLMSANFEKAVELVKSLPASGDQAPSNDDRLYFYARYKQATEGDCNTDRPGMLDFTVKAKWDAWNGVKGKSADEAKQECVEALKKKLQAIDSEETKSMLAQLSA